MSNFGGGRVYIVRLAGLNAQAKAPYGKRWLILSGEVQHITGTNTTLAISDGARVVWRSTIDTAIASDFYPLFNNLPQLYQSAPIMLMVEYDWTIQIIYGGVGVAVNLLVWEFPI